MKPLNVPLSIAFLVVAAFSPAGAAESSGWARISPFTDVEVVGDIARVVYDGKAYELVSIEGIATADILAFCRKEFDRRWEDRFATDLVEVMRGLGKPVGQKVSFVLRDPKTGQLIAVDRAQMTRENRDAVQRAMRDRPRMRITPDQMRQSLDAFQAALEDRWSYLGPSRFDHKPMIAAIRQRIDKGISIGEFLIELQKVIGRGIDGHAAVGDWERFLPAGSLPFLIEPVGERYVAFRPDRSGFLSDGLPYIESIDGRPINDWIETASAFIPDGSPQYVRRNGLRLLRMIQFLRKERGMEQKPTAEVVLTSPDGAQRRTIQLDLVAMIPDYGIWPREDARPDLPAGIAYLRLVSMDTSKAAVVVNTLAVAAQAGAKGVIIDVRDNGGGARDALRPLAAALMPRNATPRVVNAAVQRLHPEHGAPLMESRYLYPEQWEGWGPAQRQAIAEFKARFKPEWTPPADAYSPWHYMVLRPAPADRLHFDKPVVILMNAKCFSATDVFLSALKGLPNVTLVGTSSGGGSANIVNVPLGEGPLRLRIGTMVSFQADGRLFDTHGVEPDVRVEPEPEFFIGGRDNQLQEAVRIIGGK